MTSNKGESSSSSNKPLCCMCGDYGLSSELFRCKICQFRSQHRYCSNLYPRAESYGLCNWCLSLEKGEKSQNLIEENGAKTKRKFGGDEKISSYMKVKNGAPYKLQVKNHNHPINKQKTESPESSPPAGGGGRRRMEARLRRTKSDSGIVKHVFKNKVRRYKLLDEVSTQ